MQILLDARLITNGEGTGVETYARHMIRGLVNRNDGNAYTIFHNSFRPVPLPADWKQKAARTVSWGIPNRLYDLWQPPIDSLIHADIVYTPHINYLRTRHARRVITIHDLSFIHYPEFFSLRHRLWHMRQRVREQARDAALIVTLSEYTKADIVNTLGIQPEKVKVIPPGIEVPLRLTTAEERTPPLRDPYLLCLSSLEPRKNIYASISALAILRTHPAYAGLRLVIAGRKSWNFRKMDMPGVMWWGPASTAEKAMLYTGAQALLFPSFFEGFGFPPLEAQSYGCPVVASDRASLPEILGDSALYASPWNVGALAAAAQRIMEDQNLRRALTLRGKENIARYSWERSICELSNTFSSLS